MTEKFTKKLRTKRTKSDTVWSTPGGTLNTDTKCSVEFSIPELQDARLIKWDMYVTKNLGAYDMILGHDLMTDLGIDIHFSTKSVTWDGVEIPMKDRDATFKESFHVGDTVAMEEAATRIREILEAKYEKANLRDICDKSMHLETEQQEQLFRLLSQYEELFNGELGHWDGDDYKIDLIEGATPYHAKAFPIPRVHLETLRAEVQRLCDLGVLKRVNRSEWAAPTFIIPKKDGSVRFISDFRELNKRIKRKPYPIPKIQNLLLQLEGFQYATSLDLNMGYYHIELSPDAKKLCTIVLPFGKFEYQRLPMGLCNSPDIFQEKMYNLMLELEYVRAYIDDLLVTTKGSFEDHLDKLEAVLIKLQGAGLKVNAKKSFFAREGLEYLGYWISREGIQPLTAKVEAIQRIAPPKNKRELRRFIGLVNYYRDMWIRRSHVLAPLARLTSKDVNVGRNT